MWGNTVRGNIARGNKVGEDLSSLLVIIKRGKMLFVVLMI